jgi:ABC-type transport system substrate-binding protein
MSLAINREEMAQAMFLGFAEPGGQWCMFPGTWGWNPSWKADPYDPAKVKALLKEAGYPEKFPNPVIKVWATTRGVTPDFMQALAGYWEAAGIQTQVLPMENAEFGKYFFVRANPKNKETIYGSLCPFIWGAALNNVYHSANLYCNYGAHSTGYDPKMNEMYNNLVNETDPQKAIQLYREFQEYGFKEYINLGTLMIYQQFVVGPKVKEFTKKWHEGYFIALVGLTLNE